MVVILSYGQDVEVFLAFLDEDVFVVEERGGVDDVFWGGHFLLVDLEAGDVASEVALGREYGGMGGEEVGHRCAGIEEGA